jgi:Cu/Ag efflux pump CusA
MQVNRAIFFSAAIIIAGFIPLFTMSGVEGHIFGPMARTYAYAIAGGLIATFTVSPALSSLLLPERLQETETWIVRWMRKIYSPVVEFALDNRIVALGAPGIVFVLAILAARGLGSEFLPHLEEGNLWIRASMPPAISLGRRATLMSTACAGSSNPIRKSRPWSRSMAGPTTAPTPPAFSMPNSSRRSSRSINGRYRHGQGQTDRQI